jgi:hypothetical protein
LKNSKFRGFRTKFIPVPAALNLKENVDVVVDGCEIRESGVALRLRGHSKGAEMWPTVVNCVIRDCDVAVRHEDRLHNFRFVHNTVDACPVLFVKFPPRSPRGEPWIVANNLFVKASSLPDGVSGSQNRVVGDGALDPQTLIPASVGRLAGSPVQNAMPDWYEAGLNYDRMGATRSKVSPTMGAFEANVVSRTRP